VSTFEADPIAYAACGNQEAFRQLGKAYARLILLPRLIVGLRRVPKLRFRVAPGVLVVLESGQEGREGKKPCPSRRGDRVQ